MKVSRLFLPLSVLTIAAAIVSCDDDSSQIGNSLTEGNVSIYVDSITFNLNARSIENVNYDSRSGSLLLGSINVPGYGYLHSSFISRMMCVTDLNLPEEVDASLIDSCQMVLSMVRGNLVGDSLAPQVVKVYQLLSQIPDNITNEFNPAVEIGYDNMKLLGSKSFTASAMNLNDSLYYKRQAINIPVDLGKEFAVNIFNEYKNNPGVFLWPQTFAKDYFPGIFVETSFGRGCVSTISDVTLALFYHTIEEKKETVDDQEVVKNVVVPDTIYPFSISPEVLSSNNILYNPAESLKQKIENGEIIITTPGGYNASFTFPAQQIIDRYNSDEHNLSLVSDLTLTLPAEEMENEYGLTAAPDLLMVKTSELNDFFLKNKLPDSKTSFAASYDSEKKNYTFSSMRPYIIDLLGKSSISADDVEFSLVPVNLVKVTDSDYYGNSTTYVTKCLPYTLKPTMTLLHTEKALIVFSFSSQKFD